MVGLFNSTFCLKIVAQDTTNFYYKVIFFTLQEKIYAVDLHRRKYLYQLIF